jgi:GNAT superfamily N-acetyltransferase
VCHAHRGTVGRVAYNSRVSDASDGPISLDLLAHDILARSGFRFTLATTDAERDAAYRLRYQAVVDQGWAPVAERGRLDAGNPDAEGRERAVRDAAVPGLERDRYDDRAVHVLGWDGEHAIATGRLVLPPGSLPTEDVCRIRVEPRGRVADVGRMTVARSYQGPGHGAFTALLARLYLEVRARGYDVACGIMSVRARTLMRLLGLHVEVLGADLEYWGELRAPVRFAVLVNSTPSTKRGS